MSINLFFGKQHNESQNDLNIHTKDIMRNNNSLYRMHIAHAAKKETHRMN